VGFCPKRKKNGLGTQHCKSERENKKVSQLPTLVSLWKRLTSQTRGKKKIMISVEVCKIENGETVESTKQTLVLLFFCS
jgi:hypothetical protein